MMKKLRAFIKEGEMDNNQAAAPGKKKPKPGAFTNKQQTPKNQNDKTIDTEQSNTKAVKPDAPLKADVDNQEKVNLKGPKTKVILNPKLELKNPPISPSVKEEVSLLEKLRQYSYIKGGKPYTGKRKLNHAYKVYNRGHYKNKPYNVADQSELTSTAPTYIPPKDRAKWVARHKKGQEIGYKHKGAPQSHIAEADKVSSKYHESMIGQHQKGLAASGADAKKRKDHLNQIKVNRDALKKLPVKEGEVLNKSQLFGGLKALTALRRKRGDLDKKNGSVSDQTNKFREKQADTRYSRLKKANEEIGPNKKTKLHMGTSWDQRVKQALHDRKATIRAKSIVGEMTGKILGPYIKAASQDDFRGSLSHHKYTHRMKKHKWGISKAVDRLTKKEDIKEMTNDKAKKIVGKFWKGKNISDKKLDKALDKRALNRQAQPTQGYRYKASEETIHEMTKAKLAAYIPAAHASVLKKKDEYHPSPKGARSNAYKIIQRTKNIGKAANKLATEDLKHYNVDYTFGPPGKTHTITKRYKLPGKVKPEDHIKVLPDHHELIKKGYRKGKVELCKEDSAVGTPNPTFGDTPALGNKIPKIKTGKSKIKAPGSMMKPISELSVDKYHSVMHAASDKARTVPKGSNEYKKHSKAVKWAAKQMDKLDELSTGLLTRYTRAAAKDTQKVEKHYTDAVAKGDTKVDFVKMFRKVGNRAVGIKKAQRKIGHNVNEMAPPIKINKQHFDAMGDKAKSQIAQAVKPRIRVPVQSTKTSLPTPMKPHNDTKPGIPHGYVLHTNPHNGVSSYVHPDLEKKQTTFQKAGGTPKSGIHVADVLKKRTQKGTGIKAKGVGLGGAGGPKPLSTTPSTAGTPPPTSKPKVATPKATDARSAEVKSLRQKHVMNAFVKKNKTLTNQSVKTPTAPKAKASGGHPLIGAFFKGLRKSINAEYQSSPTLTIIREAVHSKGGGTKGGEGSKGQDTGGDEHPITVFRKAIQLRQPVKLTHHAGDHTMVEPETAHHMLHHYQTLKPDRKLQMVNRVWHSAKEFDDVHQGKPPKIGTFGDMNRHWSLKGIKQAT